MAIQSNPNCVYLHYFTYTKIPTPTHTGALHICAYPALPAPHVLDLMRTERTHFYPQHWHLCHMGLYWFKFKFKFKVEPRF